METGVYCWCNVVNGKKYVGSTSSLGFDSRKSLHLTNLRAGTHHCRHLQNAWNKYGENNFAWMVLWRCEPDECLDWEQWWMDKLEVANPKRGYNSSPTAGSTLGCKHTHSPESSVKHAEANRRRATDPEWVARQVEALKRTKNTPENKAKASEAAKTLHADPVVGPKIRMAAAAAMKNSAVIARQRAGALKYHNSVEGREKQKTRARSKLKLTKEQIIEIQRRHSEGEHQHVLASEFGVSKGTIYNIVHNKHWAVKPIG